jgi:ribonuclease HI
MAPPVTIMESREAAEKEHTRMINSAEPPLTIYTDGSGIHGKVGAAAVAPALRTQELAYLGKETTTTVYAAELLGILMGFGIILTSNPCKAAMFTDNQAALKALRNPQRSSGQSILRRIIDALEEARVRGINVEFHWIPAHQGIEGNELADRLAKRQPVAGSREVEEDGQSQ